MARAKVVLRGSKSYQTPGGVNWERGKPKTITNPGEIDYYISNPEFTVTKLAEPKKKASDLLETTDSSGTPDETGDQPEVLTESYLNSINKADVVKIAEEMGLHGNGTKAELVAAILEAQSLG
jgi:hypothetical protein